MLSASILSKCLVSEQGALGLKCWFLNIQKFTKELFCSCFMRMKTQNFDVTTLNPQRVNLIAQFFAPGCNKHPSETFKECSDG
jgi:hypothetical protein